MAYESQMSDCIFTSEESEESIKKLFEIFQKHIEEKFKNDKYNYDLHEYLKEYSFRKISDTEVKVVLPYEDNNGRHYASRQLAEFISLVIKPGTSTQLTFVGEDGDHWGYHIEKYKVFDMYIKWEIDTKKFYSTERVSKELK